MIHQPSALRILNDAFGSQEFTARQAADALSSVFTFKTAFVALSEMSKSNTISRIKKGLYTIDGQHRIQNLGLRTLERPEISLPEGAYATGTYALSVNLSPISSPRFLDVFVGMADYPRAHFLETKEASPQPRVHPFASLKTSQLERTIDGFLIPIASEVAFVDLVKIASEKRRPVSLEYEILPFIPQLLDKWDEIRTLASREQVQEYLEVIVYYVSRIASDIDLEDVPLPIPVVGCQRDSAVSPKTLSFEGGRADEDSVETANRTGVMIETDRQGVADILAGL